MIITGLLLNWVIGPAVMFAQAWLLLPVFACRVWSPNRGGQVSAPRRPHTVTPPPPSPSTATITPGHTCRRHPKRRWGDRSGGTCARHDRRSGHGGVGLRVVAGEGEGRGQAHDGQGEQAEHGTC